MSTPPDADPPEPTEQEPTPENVGAVTFYYVKSPAFRTIHVDGVFGGLTPRGLIHLTLFNERPAIPNETVHPVNGLLVKPEDRSLRKGKDGVVREMDVNLMLDLDAAEMLVGWLTDYVQKLRKALAEAKNGGEP